MTTADVPARFAPFRRRMEAEGLPEVLIRTFEHYYQLLVGGQTGTLSRSEIDPVESVQDHDDLPAPRAGESARDLDRAVMIKLNGGLGTSMGMTQAKSLLTVKQGLSFIDIIARQVLHLRQQYQARLPLLWMNSYRTREDTQRALRPYPHLDVGLPLDFVQHKVPRILQADLTPVRWPEDPSQEWCPPGHGDIYLALQTSGTLARLLAEGYEYAFISNSDNLGATLDPRILAFFARRKLPFLMEVARRTEADRKGGHLARLKQGGLTLRESAQCPDDEGDDFQDVTRYRYFNTNNLWVNLAALARTLEAEGGILGLPMIRNIKTVDPRDAATPRCIQIETAMGAAVSVFDGAEALRVPETRFAPVKTTNDLLGLWSDLYELGDDSRLLPTRGRTLRDIHVDLDPRFYKLVNDFRERFPAGAPSLVDCDSFVVRGDVCFEADVIARGAVQIEQAGEAQRRVTRGSELGPA